MFGAWRLMSTWADFGFGFGFSGDIGVLGFWRGVGGIVPERGLSTCLLASRCLVVEFEGLCMDIYYYSARLSPC